MRPPALEFHLYVEPAEPVVGEVVELEIQIVHATLGFAGIPLFQLVGAEPWFAIEAQENSYPLVEFARYRLRAAHPGATALQLLVNFETFLGCVDLPMLVFQSTSSPPYPVAVRGDETTATATPTPTATPLQATPAGAAVTSALGRALPALRTARTWAASPRR